METNVWVLSISLAAAYSRYTRYDLFPELIVSINTIIFPNTKQRSPR